MVKMWVWLWKRNIGNPVVKEMFCILTVSNVNIPVVILCYSFIRSDHWGKLGKEYTEFLCILITACESTVI